MRKIAMTLVFILTVAIVYSQSTKKAEKAALACLNEVLSIAGKDINYVLSASIEYNLACSASIAACSWLL